MGYLVDSNVLIDYTSQRFTESQFSELDRIFDSSFQMSVITKIEVLGFTGAAEDITGMRAFIGYATILNLNDEVVEQTISLKQLMRIKTPDAIIASTALIHNLTLITNNTSDFKRIPNLKLLNPYEL